MIMNRNSRMMKYRIDPMVAAIAISSFLNVVQDLASLKILKSLNDRKAEIAVKDPFETLRSSMFIICSTKEIITIRQSKAFN